jgi:hypothetical protein
MKQITQQATQQEVTQIKGNMIALVLQTSKVEYAITLQNIKNTQMRTPVSIPILMKQKWTK